MEILVFADTNVLLWLAAGEHDQLSMPAKVALNRADLVLISTMVKLELQYLFEIKKIRKKPDLVLSHLKSHGIIIQQIDMHKLIEASLQINWTRDPFDRLITAQAALYNLPLVTKDKIIRKHYSQAIW